jgi:nucleoside 2-deoxyribosyltransferase
MPPKPRIYLAARYSRRDELCLYRADLESLGYCVVSRWLNGNHQISDDGLSVEGSEAERLRFASEDWSDLLGSDICISFTETPRNTHSRGGRHVEFGAALALGKRCIIVGPRENVFHCLLEVERADSWPAVLTDLQRTIEREERG